MNYGYARVSNREQNAARQIEALQHEGVTKIYLDKCSGKDFNRKNYIRMLRLLKPGDTLYIKSIDRLGRSPLPKPSNYNEVIAAFSNGLINSREAGSQFGVSHKTFLIWYKREKTVNKSEHSVPRKRKVISYGNLC